jgi:hypothetical protein
MELNNLRVEGNPIKYDVVDPPYLFYYLHVQRTTIGNPIQCLKIFSVSSTSLEKIY